jgi:hypothetical protein
MSGKGFVFQAGGLTGLSKGETVALAGEDEFGVVDEEHTVSGGELLGAGADEIDVRASFEDKASGLDGVAEALDTGYAAGFHAASVHEESIELDAAVGGEEAATAGVEGGVIFQDGHGGFDGVEGGAAAGEDFISHFEGGADTGLVGGCGVGGDGPGTAVNDAGWIVGGW